MQPSINNHNISKEAISLIPKNKIHNNVQNKLRTETENLHYDANPENENKTIYNNTVYPFSQQPIQPITNFFKPSKGNNSTRYQTQSLNQNLNLNNKNENYVENDIFVDHCEFNSQSTNILFTTSQTYSFSNNYVIENQNPQNVTEYHFEIFNHLKEQEFNFLPKYGYMKSNQNDINEKMRAILIDWLVDVHMKFKLVPETLFLTINLIDRYLEKKQILRTQLQLIGITAMLIACKYEEIYSPEIRDFVYITDQAYNKEDVIAMESEMLNTFDFNITTSSTFRFLELYNNFLKLDDSSFIFCRYLLELFLLDYRMLKYNPSLVAASTIYITLKITKKREWERIPSLSSYNEDKLRDCAKDICLILDGVEKSNLKAVRKKFSLPKFMEVSLIKFN